MFVRLILECLLIHTMNCLSQLPHSAYHGVPKVTVPKDAYTVRKGLTVTLVCNFNANPPAQSVQWIKLPHNTDASIHINVTKHDTKYNGSSIHSPSISIHNVQEADEANYLCQVTNAIGTGSSIEIDLVVDGGDIPTIFVPEDYYRVRQGATVKLICHYRSFPPALSVKWIKLTDQQDIEINVSDNSAKYRGSAVHSPSLTIVNVDYQDEASYICVISNDVGTESSIIIDLVVDVQGNIPVVEVPEDSYTSWEGGTVVLMCNYKSDPPAQSVQWIKIDDSMKTTIGVNSSGNKYSGSSVHSPSLTIYNVQKSDEAAYICRVTNDIGTKSSIMVDLYVDINDGGVPIVRIARNRYFAELRQIAIIDCTITSSPAYTAVYWTRYNSSSDQKIITTGTNSTNSKYRGSLVGYPSLTIFGVDVIDQGYYVCHAENSHGEGHSLPAFLEVIVGGTSTKSTTVSFKSTTLNPDVKNNTDEAAASDDFIIGIVIGSVGLAVCMIAVAIVFMCRRMNKKGDNTMETITSNVHLSRSQNQHKPDTSNVHQSKSQNQHKPDSTYYETTNRSEQHVYTDLMQSSRRTSQASGYNNLSNVGSAQYADYRQSQVYSFDGSAGAHGNLKEKGAKNATFFNNTAYLQVPKNQSVRSNGSSVIVTNGEGYLEPRNNDPNAGRKLPDIPKS